VAIAEKIIQREISQEPQLLGEVISKALSRLKDETQIQLRLRPQDKEFVDSWLAKFRDHLPDLSITTDEQSGGGGFVIDTKSGSLDYTIQTQLKRIETELENLYAQS
jgi:flagellar assembly protein FliH